jgi:hypothetical protein
MDLLQLRVIERVLAVVVGGMSVYLGYRLFIKLPEQMDSSGKVVLPGGMPSDHRDQFALSVAESCGMFVGLLWSS